MAALKPGVKRPSAGTDPPSSASTVAPHTAESWVPLPALVLDFGTPTEQGPAPPTLPDAAAGAQTAAVAIACWAFTTAAAMDVCTFAAALSAQGGDWAAFVAQSAVVRGVCGLCVVACARLLFPVSTAAAAHAIATDITAVAVLRERGPLAAVLGPSLVAVVPLWVSCPLPAEPTRRWAAPSCGVLLAALAATAAAVADEGGDGLPGWHPLVLVSVGAFAVAGAGAGAAALSPPMSAPAPWPSSPVSGPGGPQGQQAASPVSVLSGWDTVRHAESTWNPRATEIKGDGGAPLPLSPRSVSSDEGHDRGAASPEARMNPLQARQQRIARGKLRVKTIEWRKGALIGSGGWGQVHIGLNESNGELMAVKTLTFTTSDPAVKSKVEALQTEIAVMKSLEHPNIVKYYFTERSGDQVHIFMEYVPGGSLWQCLQQFGALSELIAGAYTEQVLVGVQYLHSRGVIHRDIKCANLLLTCSGLCKLADFGASALIDGIGSSARASGPRGTPVWMAPEVVSEQGHDWRCDVWSLGCTVMEMLTAKPPFQHLGLPVIAVLSLIVDSQRSLPIPTWLPRNARWFVVQCLQRDPQRRPTLNELLVHSFVRQGEVSPSPPGTPVAAASAWSRRSSEPLRGAVPMNSNTSSEHLRKQQATSMFGSHRLSPQPAPDTVDHASRTLMTLSNPSHPSPRSVLSSSQRTHTTAGTITGRYLDALSGRPVRGMGRNDSERDKARRLGSVRQDIERRASLMQAPRQRSVVIASPQEDDCAESQIIGELMIPPSTTTRSAPPETHSAAGRPGDLSTLDCAASGNTAQLHEVSSVAGTEQQPVWASPGGTDSPAAHGLPAFPSRVGISDLHLSELPGPPMAPIGTPPSA
eukprot:TRINITY_DN27315_c0_g1_i1.p1 TRINITY_DN27315_c0_g1~~TRINITY_DN27315_c0_g1_i1.p1  ORF type:complete len:892 (+),score=220.98 TRINITY_DN27315_c0_g1_i1:73-2676(+)